MDTFDILVQKLDLEIAGKKDWVASGQVADFPEYKRLSGEIHGLLLARQEILDLKRKTESSDDE